MKLDQEIGGSDAVEGAPAPVREVHRTAGGLRWRIAGLFTNHPLGKALAFSLPKGKRGKFVMPEPIADAGTQVLIAGASLGLVAGIALLRTVLQANGLQVPTLYKQYTEAVESGGASFLAFNVDPSFGFCVDGLILVDLHRLRPSHRRRYLERGLR